MALDEHLYFFELLFCSKAPPLTVQIGYFHRGVSTLHVGGRCPGPILWGYLSSDPVYPIYAYCCLFQNRPWDWNWQVCQNSSEVAAAPNSHESHLIPWCPWALDQSGCLQQNVPLLLSPPGSVVWCSPNWWSEVPKRYSNLEFPHQTLSQCW